MDNNLMPNLLKGNNKKESNLNRSLLVAGCSVISIFIFAIKSRKLLLNPGPGFRSLILGLQSIESAGGLSRYLLCKDKTSPKISEVLGES